MTEQPRIDEALSQFAPEARAVLGRLPASGGVLEPSEVRTLAGALDQELPELLVSLLPVASSFARPPVSNYRVGAVAVTPAVESEWGRLYVGGNLEFGGQALGLTLHAEQAVTLNALFGGESALVGLAVSSPPCGHCRQFLNEIAEPPDVFTVAQKGDGVTRHTLEQLLPTAFGPSDLGVQSGLLDRRHVAIQLVDTDDTGPGSPRRTAEHVTVDRSSGTADPLLIQHALEAARFSYAPYTHSYAGCAVRTDTGTVHTGGYVENAAFNPSVLALQSALLHLHLKGPGLDAAKVTEVVLVEVEGRTTQLGASLGLLDTVAPSAAFSFHRARVP